MAVLAAMFLLSFPGLLPPIAVKSGGALIVALFFALGGGNLIWLVLAAAMFIYGSLRQKPGVAAAPLAVCVLWLVASVALRCTVQVVDRLGNWSPSVPNAALGYRTLVVDYWYEVSTNVLATGAVDRLVQVGRDNNSHEITQITETTIAHGDECSAEELRVSNLGTVGRAGDCFKKRRLEAVPDGLILAYHYDVDMVHGESGCCNEIDVSRREGPQNDRLFAWRQGYVHIPSYFPYYHHPYPFTVTADHQPGIWQPDAAPWQVVRYGPPDITPAAMISAIYGIDPRTPLVRSVADDHLFANAEAAAAQGTYSDARAALTLLLEAQRRGIVDDRAPRIGASLVGFDIAKQFVGAENLDNYVDGFDEASTMRLLEAVLERIATPNICNGCRESKSTWYGLRRRLKDPAMIAARARQIFEERLDLDTWQYEAALRLVDAFTHARPLHSEHDDLITTLGQAIDRNDPRQSKKAEAFRRVFPTR